MTDTVRLNDEIKTSGLKKGWIAAELGLSSYGFHRKINNASQFKAGEIKGLCQLLNITSLEKKDEIFFADDVDKKTTNESGERGA
ncbi:hypothetical protein [Clostridium sp. Marseille-P2415]|uniref:hypothetical protein n=1 Tax=Clostridium sp. Marseille-P2415 TaxID=1805471 RepID=UPI0009883148|nr:hypothetical protein [Clostridium sp. Marseille-P2415]